MPRHLPPISGPLETDIVGFKELFLSASKGFRPRSTMLIVGPPGAGKTTFALALARSLLAAQEKKQRHVQDRTALLFYMSLEGSQEDLRQVYEPMGWFSKLDKIFQLDQSDNTTVRIVSLRPEFDRPVATSEEITNALFRRLTAALDPNDKRYVFVIVDSISALARDTGSALERRRQTHELKARLETAIRGSGSELALTMFLAERPTGIIPDIASAVEEYLVDTVFRLDVRGEVMGRRLRTLEIMKSQGVNMTLGEHTWAIISGPSLPSLIFERDHFGTRIEAQATGVHPELQRRRNLIIQLLRGRTGNPSAPPTTEVAPWGTVIIFPRIRSFGNRQSDKTPSPVDRDASRVETGTRGLDEMLDFQGNLRYWHSVGAARSLNFGKGLVPGTITLLTGPPGTGKSTLLLQFLFAHAREQPKPGTKSIYVTFDQDEADARGSVEKHWKRFCDADNDQKGTGYPDPPVQVYAVRHSQIDVNLIIAQLREGIYGNQPKRLALDGLSEWLSTCNQEKDTGLLALEGLLTSLKDVSRSFAPPVTMMLAYESPVGREPLPELVVGVPAQNIFSLRQVHLAEASRRMIYIVKAGGLNSDPNPREIVFNKNDQLIEIRPGFDEHAGLIEGEPGLAKVVLQLFSENDFQRFWNEGLVDRLKEIRNLEYKQLGFTRTEIGRTLEESDFPTHFPPSDLKILEVDEWWICKPTHSPTPHPLLPLTDLWRPRAGQAELASWREFWFVELEKAVVPFQQAEHDAGGELYAIPGHMDFGMFCTNIGVLGRLLSTPHKTGSFAGQQSDNLGEPESKVATVETGLPQNTAYLLSEQGRAMLVSGLSLNVDFSKACRSLADDQRSVRQDRGNILSGIRAWARRWEEEEIATAKEVWQGLLGGVPRKWLPDKLTGMFEQPGHRPDMIKVFAEYATMAPATSEIESILDLGLIVRSIDPEAHLFAFDTSTPETCVCFFFEMAWAFGAREDFLIHEAHDIENLRNNLEQSASVRGLFLAQYLVMANLMPAGADVHTAGAALFSRQWYSTLAHSGRDRFLLGHPLMAVPFWPVAASNCGAFRAALGDCEIRLTRFIQRLDKALRAAEHFFRSNEPLKMMAEEHLAILATCRETLKGIGLPEVVQSLRNESTAQASESRRLRRLLSLTTLIDPLLNSHPEGSSLRLALSVALPRIEGEKDALVKTPPVPGFVDLEELWSWHTLRMRMLVAEASGKSLQEAIGKWKLRPTPDQAEQESALESLIAGTGVKGLALVGQGATGSWMYGVHHSSRSVTIARDLIQELTSTQTVHERAVQGAGIPPRKDFYQACGDQPVPFAEHLSWHDLLRFNLVHARRRDRVLCRGIDPAEIYKLIRDQVVRCLDYGARHRIQPSGTEQEAKARRAEFQARLEGAWRLSVQAVAEIVRTISNRMSAMGPSTCRECPARETCTASRGKQAPSPP